MICGRESSGLKIVLAASPEDESPPSYSVFVSSSFKSFTAGFRPSIYGLESAFSTITTRRRTHREESLFTAVRENDS